MWTHDEDWNDIPPSEDSMLSDAFICGWHWAAYGYWAREAERARKSLTQPCKDATDGELPHLDWELKEKE